MPTRFALLLNEHTDALTRVWVDEIYAERRTDLPVLLSYRELVEYLPEVFEELGASLDRKAAGEEIAEAARRLRFHAQVRFQQGCLIDEVARELTILRNVLVDFFWQEGISATEGDIWELRDALRRTHGFVDELMVQMILVYAASLRPNIRTRASFWPPPRRRRNDFPERDERK